MGSVHVGCLYILVC